MLQTLREHSGSWFVKVLFGVLVASFALWGVGDIFRNYTSMRPIATIGASSITQEEFLSAYQKAINNLQQVAKGKITGEQIKAMGVPTKILENLIDQAALKEHIHHLGLVVSDTTIRDQIQSIPAFKNKDGVFDRSKFDYMLSNNGLTEAGFIHEVRTSIERQQLLTALGSNINFPKFYVETLFKGLEEKRVFITVQVPLSKISVTAKPTDAELEQLYKQNQEAFTLPEYRELAILFIDPTVVRSKIQVSEEQLAEEYQRRKIDFFIPEKRDIQQIIFISQSNAEKAAEALKKGRSLQSVASEHNGKLVELPHTTKEKLTTEQAKVVFELTAGGISQPVESALGWSIFHVTKIDPERQQSLEEVRAKLLEDYKTQQANELLYEIRNKIEDSLAGGASFGDVAKEYGFAAQHVPAIDRHGKDQNGKSVLEPEYQSLILEHAFHLSEGTESQIIDLPNGKSFLVRLNKIAPPSVPPLKDIRDKVATAWIESKQQETAADLAQQVVKEAKSIQGLTNLAKHHGLTVKVLPAISRTDLENRGKEQPIFNPQVVQQGFTLRVNQAAMGPTKDGFEIIMLQKVVPLDLNAEKEKFEKFKQSLELMGQRDFEQLYLKYLRQEGKVSINQSIFENITNRQ
jgi:peptidyl-prolyl cis-trans isomerase D